VIRPLRALPFALLLAACSESSGPAEIVTRDSAGITIIEHPVGAVAAAPLWSLGEPTLTIGGGEGAEQDLVLLTSAVRLPDGRIVLSDVDRITTRFLVYRADGSFDRQLGRSGSGPGEFRSARILGLFGDTLVIYDYQGARVTRMTSAGELAGTAELARLGPMKIGMPEGIFGDGRLFTTPIPFGDSLDHGSGVYRQESAAMALDPDSVTLDTLQQLPGAEVKLTEMSFGGQRNSFPAPIGYGKRTLVGIRGDLAHVATNDGAQVTTYRLPWALTRVVRFAETTTLVDQPARDAQIAERIASIQRMTGTPDEFKNSMIESARNMPFADSMAYFQTMTVATDGGLWLRQMRSSADSVPRYIVLGPDGRLSGRIDLPKGARLLWTDGAVAIISILDEDDLPRAELRPVVKGPATN
jgi:hypothetical protein